MIALWVGLAWADSPEELDGSAFAGPALPKLAEIPESPDAGPNETVEAGKEFPAVVYSGAKALDLEPAFVDGVRNGLGKLFARDYKGTREHFAAFEVANPGYGLDAFADLLVFQALMFENYDFKYEKSYLEASKRCKTKLETAVKAPGHQAFEEFLLTGVVGIAAIHGMRKEQYIGALSLAFEAMDHASKSRAAAPAFGDLDLADGLYNYWRTVITLTSRVLPDFGDHRVEGIRQMQAVEANGVFMSAPATLALTYTWIEEHDDKRALASAQKSRAKYPESAINNLVLGRTYINNREYDKAIAVFGDILKAVPDHRFVWYYKGIAEMRSGKLPEAEASLRTFLGFPELEVWQRSNAWYRMGQLRYRQERWTDAREAWKTAIKIDGNDRAKLRLTKLDADHPAN